MVFSLIPSLDKFACNINPFLFCFMSIPVIGFPALRCMLYVEAGQPLDSNIKTLRKAVLNEVAP